MVWFGLPLSSMFCDGLTKQYRFHDAALGCLTGWLETKPRTIKQNPESARSRGRSPGGFSSSFCVGPAVRPRGHIPIAALAADALLNDMRTACGFSCAS